MQLSSYYVGSLSHGVCCYGQFLCPVSLHGRKQVFPLKEFINWRKLLGYRYRIMSSCPLSAETPPGLDLCRSWGCCLSLCELIGPLVSWRPCFLNVFHSNWLSHSTSSSTGFPEPVVAVTVTAQSTLELRPRYNPIHPLIWSWPLLVTMHRTHMRDREPGDQWGRHLLLCVHYKPEVLITERRSNGECANPIEGIHPLGQGGNSTLVCVPTTKMWAMTTQLCISYDDNHQSRNLETEEVYIYISLGESITMSIHGHKG